MKLNEHERPRPNPGGVVSSGQQAEMKLLLAGGWPSLKPLPVFKYESTECRASIAFDKARGEWICRKTFFPSNNVQEFRGGLAELMKSLPPALGEASVPRLATALQGEEFAREASRRLQAILEWKANFENGVLYSDLQNYLSESQQQEMEEILRLTLTARQLQFSPKNIACVFDGLSKAGGRLATLLEVAKRKKAPQVEDPVAIVEAAATEIIPPEPDSGEHRASVENSPVEEIENVFSPQEQSDSAELSATDSAPEETISAPRESLDADPHTFFAESAEEVDPPVSIAAFRREVRRRKLDAAASGIANLPSGRRALEISGFHIAAFAVVFLFAVISLPIGLTVGRGPLGQWLRDIQQAMFAGHEGPVAAPVPTSETPSRTSASLPENTLVDASNVSETAKRDDLAPREEDSNKRSARNSESLAEAPTAVSNLLPRIESKPSTRPEPSAAHDGSAGIIARVPAPPTPRPTRSFNADVAGSGAWKNRASRSLAPSMGASPHRAAPAGILVTTPAHGSKPFRVNFPEKAIAASSSFAMASELSVLVPPEPGPVSASKSARLQAGELVYFVWPRYKRQGDRYGTAETVRVRATVGQFGQVLDVKLLSGSAALFPAARSAVHQWRYKPTLLNGRSIAVQQDITIEFRPPQYLSQVHTQHPSHN